MFRKDSIPDLAYQVLKKEGKPLHYQALTKKIMKKKKTTGKTPWNTVNSILCTHSSFKRIGGERSGIYGLAEWK